MQHRIRLRLEESTLAANRQFPHAGGQIQAPDGGGRDEIICPAAGLKSAYGAIEKFEKIQSLNFARSVLLRAPRWI